MAAQGDGDVQSGLARLDPIQTLMTGYKIVKPRSDLPQKTMEAVENNLLRTAGALVDAVFPHPLRVEEENARMGGAKSKLVLAPTPRAAGSPISSGKGKASSKVSRATAPAGKAKVPKALGSPAHLPGSSMSTAPVMHGFSTSYKAPVVSSRADGCTVSHRSFVTDFPGTTTYETMSYAVTPANGELFPWLSQLARNWTYYKFKRLAFYVLSSVPTIVGGVNMLVLLPDATYPVPPDKATLLNTEGAVRTVAWESAGLSIPRKMINQIGKRTIGRGFQQDVNSSSQLPIDARPTDEDLRFQMAGTLVVATDQYLNPGAIPVAGELWVDYEVDLSVAAVGDQFLGSCSVVANATTGLSLANSLGTGPFLWEGVPGSVAITQGIGKFTPAPRRGGFFITIPGTYSVVIVAQAAGTVNISFPTQLGGNVFHNLDAVADAFSVIFNGQLDVHDVDFPILMDFQGLGIPTFVKIFVSRIAPRSYQAL